MVGRNITVLSEKYCDHVRTEYGEIINDYEISNCYDAISDFLDESNTEKVPNKRHGKYKNS